MNEQTSRGATQCASPWWRSEQDLIAHIEDDMEQLALFIQPETAKKPGIEVYQITAGWFDWWERMYFMSPMAHPDCTWHHVKEFHDHYLRWDRAAYRSGCYTMKHQFCVFCKKKFEE